MVRVRHLLRLLSLLFALGCSLGFAYAQSATATLNGTVTDEKGAVVPGVNVIAMDPATNFQRQTTTNKDGAFAFTQLPPSKYTVKVEGQGFASLEIAGVELNVNDVRSLPIQLKVGPVESTVQVTSEPVLVDQSPAVDTTIDRHLVANLPLNGRSFQSLFELTPGVVLTTSGNGNPGQFSVNGQRSNANYFTIDGVGANVGSLPGNSLGQSANGAVAGFAATGGTNNLVSVDALQEFKIQTSTYAPEFGRTPGGQVSIITRSGTNDFHGTAFEYFRNDALDANDWFANRAGLARAPERQHDFGGVFGGPLYLPHFGEGGPSFTSGKNRTFFFFSYEGLRLRLPQTNTFFVPSMALRQIAAPSIRPILNAFPQPNAPPEVLNGQLTGYAPYNVSYSDQLTLNATSIRIDHNVTKKVNVFGRYNDAPSSGTDRLTNPSTPGTTHVDTRTFTLGSTQIFSAKLVNDLRFNYTKYKSSLNLVVDTQGGAVPPDTSIFSPGQQVKNPVDGFFLVELTPSFMFRFAPGIFIGPLSNNSNQQVNIVDSLSYQKSNHALKFGVDYRRLSPTFEESDYFITYATFTFSSLTNNNLVNGLVNQIQISADKGQRNPIFHNFSVYGQDTWNASRRMTLTYGLRWDINPAPKEKNGLNPAVLTNLDTPANIALAPSGTPLYQTYYGGFSPRLGISYQLRQKPGWETMLRGGFGIFYDLGGGGSVGSAFGQTFPYASQSVLFDFGGFPFPVTPAQATPAPITGSLPATTLINAFDPNLKLPRAYQWNFTVEQSLGANQSIWAGYVAALGRDLLRVDFLNAPNANFPQGVAVTRNTADSDYHSMQVQFNRRLSRGLQGMASYTWAHSIDTASSDVSRFASITLVTPGRDRGPSDFDIRHSFSSALTYDLPAPAESGAMKAVFGGWSTDAIFQARSAPPVNVTIQNVNLGGVSNVVRPNLTGAPIYLHDSTAPGGTRLNPAAFVNPPAGQQGSLGRNAVRGFGAWQLDFTVRRTFHLTERVGLQFRSEFFNIFNHPNFALPVSNFGNPLFGQATQMLSRGLREQGSSTGAGFNALYQIGGPRSVQFALRLTF